MASTSESGPSTYTRLEPSEEQISRIKERMGAVKQRISKATENCHRTNEPRLVAISKLHPPTAILAAHQHANQVHFGENYAQELEAKAKVLPTTIKWHFVGKLQSNKAKLVAAIPNLYLLETLDSIKCANALEKAIGGQGKGERDGPLGVYLQVNTSAEEAKGGLPPLTENSDEKELIDLAKHVMTECPSLRLQGLMTIGAASNSQANAKDKEDNSSASGKDATEMAEQARKLNPDFATLYQTRRQLIQQIRGAKDQLKDNSDDKRYADLLSGDRDDGGLELSMGMSGDLEVAIEAGSDNVRVGTDCFGVRPPSREEAMEGMKDELEG